MRSRILAVVASAVFLASACQGSTISTVPVATAPPSVAPPSVALTPSVAPPASRPPAVTKVRLQLQWVAQAQFAGYLAAVKQGYYAAEGIEVTIVPGGPGIAPQRIGSEGNGPEFTVSWVPKMLQAREASPASDLVDIAQVFQRSGTLSVSFKTADITSPKDFVHKRVGVWGFGNEFEVTAAATKYGLQPGKGYTKVIQAPDVSSLLTKQVDVAEAMIYNEYARILETTNPETGALYRPVDLDVINYNDEGTAMLQDAVFARASWLAKSGNEEVAVRFLKASFEGWIFCRDHQADCVKDVRDAGADGSGSPTGSPDPGAGASAGTGASESATTIADPGVSASLDPSLRTGHQAWQLNEVNALIWPSPNGIGLVDPSLWKRSVDIAVGAGILREAPSEDALRMDLATTALSELSDLDAKGSSFQRSVVDIAAGGF